MKTTQEFKVGDIVRFKADPEHQEYARQYYDRPDNLKIKRVTTEALPLVGFEGYPLGLDSFAFRLEKQPTNMFTFGKKNPKIKKLFLDYFTRERSTGLCSYSYSYSRSILAYNFLKAQPVFDKEDEYPVEYFILRSMKKSTEAKSQRYGKSSQNDPGTPEGRLRIWWATNLAIAASQGKI